MTDPFTGGTVQLLPGHEASGPGFFGVPSGTVTLVGQSVGHLEWTGGTWMGSALTNPPGSTLTLACLSGNLTLLYGILDNGGIVNWQGTGDLIAGNTYYNQTVTIYNRAGALWNFWNDQTLTPANTSGYGAPGFQFENDGTISKKQTSGTNLFANVTFNNRGAIELERGCFQFTGNYNSGPASQLTIGIGGTSPVSEHGQIKVGGTAILAGTLAARLAPHYLPVADQVFTIIEAGATSGTFANTDVPTEVSVVYFVPNYEVNKMLLTAKFRSGVYLPLENVVVKRNSNIFGFQFPATPGVNYLIDVSSNLVDWIRLTITNTTGSVITLQDPFSTAIPCRFYRVFSDQ